MLLVAGRDNKGSNRGFLPTLAWAACALSAVGLSLPVAAQTLSAYDTFSTANFNSTKWYGDEGRTYGGTRLEAHRSIVANQARIELRAWGDTTASSGMSSSRNSLIATKSPSMTAMRGILTMRSFAATACAANPSQPSVARARLFGFFFNAGDATPGSNFNDVFAGVQVSRASNTTDAANTFRVSGFAGICGDDSCIASSSLGNIDLGTVVLNTATTLQMSWDTANKRFVFQRDGQAANYLPYTISDAQVASFPVKRMEISNVVPRCIGGTRPSVVASADFDSIYINSNAVAAATGPLGWLAPASDTASIDPLVGPLN